MQLTYQCCLYLEESERDKIDKAMENVGKFYRTCFNNFWFQQGKTYLDLKKKEFCANFGIGTKQANSLIKEAQAKVEMWQEFLCYVEKAKRIKLTSLQKQEKKLLHLLEICQQSKIKILKAFQKREKVIKRIKRLKSRIWSNHRKQEKIQAWLKKEKSITFGSKSLQRKLSKEKGKGKIKSLKLLKLWRDVRNNFIYGLGESDVTYGNNTIKLLNENQVQIEVENLEKVKVKIRLREKIKDKLLNATKKTARIIKKIAEERLNIIVNLHLILSQK